MGDDATIFVSSPPFVLRAERRSSEGREKSPQRTRDQDRCIRSDEYLIISSTKPKIKPKNKLGSRIHLPQNGSEDDEILKPQEIISFFFRKQREDTWIVELMHIIWQPSIHWLRS